MIFAQKVGVACSFGDIDAKCRCHRSADNT